MYSNVLTKLESNIYGLKYIPSIEPTYSNSADYIDFPDKRINIEKSNGNGQFSFKNGEITLYEFLKIKDSVKCIMEIGVATNFEHSSTELWLKNKTDDCHYFGIDIKIGDKSHHEQYKPNTHILGMNSETDREHILEKMKEFGCEKEIDVLFIDGCHSIDLMINDWKYSELVRKGGLILLHDVNIHPGPHLVYDAIDEELFTKEKYFCDGTDDCGLGVVWKK